MYYMRLCGQINNSYNISVEHLIPCLTTCAIHSTCVCVFDAGPIPQGIRLALLPRNGASQAALTFVDLDPELLLNDKDRMLSIFKREVGTAKDMESMHMTTLRGQDVYFMLDGKNATLKQFIDGVTRGEDARVVGEASARVFAVKDCDSPKNVTIVFRADNLIIDSSILGGAPAPANASDPPGQVPTMAQVPTSGAASFNPAAADQHQSSAASVLPLYYGVMSVLFYVSIFY